MNITFLFPVALLVLASLALPIIGKPQVPGIKKGPEDPTSDIKSVKIQTLEIQAANDPHPTDEEAAAKQIINMRKSRPLLTIGPKPQHPLIERNSDYDCTPSDDDTCIPEGEPCSNSCDCCEGSCEYNEDGELEFYCQADFSSNEESDEN